MALTQFFLQLVNMDVFAIAEEAANDASDDSMDGSNAESWDDDTMRIIGGREESDDAKDPLENADNLTEERQPGNEDVKFQVQAPPQTPGCNEPQTSISDDAARPSVMSDSLEESRLYRVVDLANSLFKLAQEGVGTDLKFVCGDGNSLTCHSAILGCHHGSWKQLLTELSGEHSEQVVVLCPYTDFQSIQNEVLHTTLLSSTTTMQIHSTVHIQFF